MADQTLHRYRSHKCGDLCRDDVGRVARLSGWVHRVRDHGGLLFIDLRDHYGLTQIVADPESAAFKMAETIRSEWVIRVDGKVRHRPAGTVNPDLPTGEVEVFASEIEVLSAAKELPVPVFGEPDYPEDLRLQYRFLDLRRETLHANIMQRLAIVASIRRRMTETGFFEFSTPILTASSPEGARDFLVPSRLYAGKFYALPQAPQQYKQLLMMSGFDRYFQIAPCFRDEDPRADRLPGEFYQLDVEMSFVEQGDVFSTMEPVLHGVFEEFASLFEKDVADIFDQQELYQTYSQHPHLKKIQEALDCARPIKAVVVRSTRADNFSLVDDLNSYLRRKKLPSVEGIYYQRDSNISYMEDSYVASKLLGHVSADIRDGLPKKFRQLSAGGSLAEHVPRAWLVGLAIQVNAGAGDLVLLVTDNRTLEACKSYHEIKNVNRTWSRIPYADAVAKYGSDKPDLRNPIVMQDVSESFRDSDFKVFARLLESDSKTRVWAIPAPSGGSRAFCDRMNAWAQSEGQPGLAYIYWASQPDGGIETKIFDASYGHEIAAPIPSGFVTYKFVGPEGQELHFPKGPIARNIGLQRCEEIRTTLGLTNGDAVFFTAGDPAKFYKFAGLARDKVGQELKLIDENSFALAWIVDFPMYEWNEDEKKVDFSHNPFSMPQGGLAALEGAKSTEDILQLKAFQYDLVCNGYELASGSIRNHLPEAMIKAFGNTGVTPEEVQARFGGMYRAFQYGAPPHGGMAAGIDRIVMLLVGAKNLREVTLFPMNQQAMDLLMGAPSDVMPKQLKELHLRVVEPPKKA